MIRYIEANAPTLLDSILVMQAIQYELSLEVRLIDGRLEVHLISHGKE